MKAGRLAAVAAVLLATAIPAAADRFLDGLGLEFQVISPRAIRVEPYPDQKLWLSGLRVYTHDPSQEGYVIRLGDAVDEWEAGVFHRYHLVRLQGTVATFTRETYQGHESYLGDRQTRLSSGRLIRTESVTVDLAPYAIVDWDPILHVETSDGRVYHSKSP